MNNRYKGLIWTKHALSRMHERGIKQGDAWVTWRRPDKSRHSKAKGSWIYYKTYGNQRIEVVAKKNEKKEWIILSVWSKTVFEKKASGPKGHRPGGKKETIGGYLFRKIFRKS